MDPIDYTINTPSPAAAAQSGFTFGQGMKTAAFGEQQQNFAFQQQQLAAQRAAQQRADLAALAANPAPTARDYASVVLKYPELKDSFKDSYANVSAEQKQQKLDAAAPIFAALQSNRPDLAAELAQKNVDALRNSGASEKDIKAADTWLQLIKETPNHAGTMGGVFLASVMGPDKFEAAFGKAGSEQRENLAAPGKRAETAAKAAKEGADANAIPARTAAEIANINSQIANRAGQLALDTDKLASETALKLNEITQKYGQIHPDARKVVNEAAGASVMASNTAVQMRSLAEQFDKLDAYQGGAGAAAEAMKALTGEQNYATQLRKEYTRIRALQVNSMLPPGPASDKDIQNAQAGFLKETANKEEIASWLRGVAKLQEYQAKYEDARGEWVAAVGHLGKTPKDIEIGGVKVPAGTTLTDFVRKTLKAPGSVTQPPQPGKETDYMTKYGTANGATGNY